MKLTNACGRNPASRYVVTLTTGPWRRLESLVPSGRDQQRQMRELRRLRPDRFKNQDVLERVGEMILAANDVADAQIGIVGAGGQMIRRRAVAAQQREVLDVGRGLGLLAINAVVKRISRTGSRGTR